MSVQNLLKTLKTVKRSHSPSLSSSRPFQDIPEFVSRVLSNSFPDNLEVTLPIINFTQLHQILSNPNLKASSCLHFFNFILKNQSRFSLRPDLQAHLTLISRLVKASMFADAERILKSVSVDENLRYPFLVLAPAIENCCSEPRVVAKVFNLVFKVYSDNRHFDQVMETFDYMKNIGIKIDERTCTVHLLSLKRNNLVGVALRFFYQMVELGIEISVYSLTVVVEGICRSGDVSRGRELVEEMVGRVKPNIITYNIMIDHCAKRWNFNELDMILKLMEKEGQAFDIKTYKILIDGYSSAGKVEKAERLISEMHHRGKKVDTYMYNLIINGYGRLGITEKVNFLFDKMKYRGVHPNGDTYWALINGLSKVGKMEMAMFYVSEMLSKAFQVDEVIFNTLVHGFCRKGMINEAFELQIEMERIGFEADVSLCNRIATGLCELNRADEAKMWFSKMIKRGINPKMMSFTALIGT